MYEGMFIFVEQLNDEELEAAVKELREEIEKLGGSIENTARMGRRPFARLQAKHHKAGHYIVMNFQMGGEAITPLLARMKLNEKVLRTQIIRQDQPATAAVAEPAAAEG
jgi:ribosomal protein S6